MPLLFDTGPLYALADADDAWHERVRDLVDARREPLLVPVTVLPEVTYLLHRRLGPEVERQFVGSLVAGELVVEELRREDVARAEEVLSSFPRIGFVDATVLAIAERLRLPALVTTDRRHFAALRPRHVDALELLP
ncbi:MAG: PIN domain-containing protein [Acidobacteriota bacterium]|nr:PIN domain-containing protein [Acidobacteriota bacterium]MDH3523753.1 PIN domain-containing protein [Acidobacteriota bacterium]